VAHVASYEAADWPSAQSTGLTKVDLMTVASQSRNRYLDRPSPSSLADVLDTILDKGLVIDIYVRVSLVGIELLTIDARIVIASVDTYLRFAEAVNRLDLTQNGPKKLPELVEDMT
jgi:gas vesicle structural protein